MSMGSPLVWKVGEEVKCEYDPTYVEYRRWDGYSGTKRIAQVKVWYGDENSANSTRGSVSGAQALGMFKKHWVHRGYTWIPTNPYVPACMADTEPRDWVDQQWAKWLTEASL
jgi:hypothetical protein